MTADRTAVSVGASTGGPGPGQRGGELGHVLILAGGLSPEREVSLHSGDRIQDALREVGVDAHTVDADAVLIPRLTSDPPTAVFPAIWARSRCWSGSWPSWACRCS